MGWRPARSKLCHRRLENDYTRNQGTPERNHRALPLGSLIHTAFCANRSTVVNRRVRPPEARAQRESRARRLENIGNQQAKARVECERRRLPLSSTRTSTGMRSDRMDADLPVTREIFLLSKSFAAVRRAFNGEGPTREQARQESSTAREARAGCFF